MRYVAELTGDDDKLPIANTEFQAPDDAEASRLAQEWAVIEFGQMLNRVVHLQVVQDHRGVFSKTYGSIS